MILVCVFVWCSISSVVIGSTTSTCDNNICHRMNKYSKQLNTEDFCQTLQTQTTDYMSLVYLKTRIPQLIRSNKSLICLHFSSCIHLLPHHDIFACNSLLKSSTESENAFLIFRQMLQCNIKPNDLTFSLLIKSFTSHLDSLTVKQEASEIHSHLLKCGFDRFDYVGTSFLDFYAKSGCMLVAEQLFEEMLHKDVVAWNSLICGYLYNGYDLEAFGAFVEMLEQGLCPCPVTMVSVIPACGKLGFLYQGKSVHGFGVKIALDLDSRVENALTAMYAKCGDLKATRLLFEGMLEKSVVSWNTMIGAYGQNGYVHEAFLVFKRMRGENVEANSITVVSLLSAGAPLDLVHSYAIKIGVDSDDTVHTSLVCTYARLGKTESAYMLYESVHCRKNLVSVTAIISSYAEKGDIASALECFNQIRVENIKPDAVTMVSILHGCTNWNCNGAIGIGLHGCSIKSGLDSNTLVINGLISMYGKLNDIDASTSLFSGLDERPLISWNSMISTYVQVGRLNDAINLCCQMKMSGSSPDTITVASILSGCSQLSLLHAGKSLHSFVLRNNLEVDDFTGTAFIDMYAKCGSIEYAERVFEEINAPCLPAWNAMISGYGMYGLEQKALGDFSEMIRIGIKPDKITFLAVLSACSHTGLVEDGQKYFRMMNENFGLEPGPQHYACMVDLFSRAGLLDEAFIFVQNMKAKPDSVVLLALLGACYMHKEVKLAEYVAKKIFLLDQRNGGVYVLMSNIYATAERWNDVAKVRNMKSDIGDDGFSGTSLIEVVDISFR